MSLPARTRELVEMLASMRFAIALLSLIGVASVIGTVVQQRQPEINYLNQFGPFWAGLFERLGLFSVYSAPWFLLILAFLVVSTSLCVARNTPKILRDLRDPKTHLRAATLAAYHHKALVQWPQPLPEAQSTLAQRLQALGWSPKLDVRADGTLIAARQGGAHKLGYIAAHSAIVLVLLGGLLDGDLIVRTLAWAQGKTLYTGTGNTVANVEPHRLPERNPSYRANLFVPEGERSSAALISLPGGVLVQQLPFELELKKFIVEYYDTGVPKLFASEVVVRDAEGERSARIEVNKPLLHQGVRIYQSSFEDGGSAVTMRVQPLAGGLPQTLQGRVNQGQPLPGTRLTLEPSELRVINVEDTRRLSSAAAASAAPAFSLRAHLGAGARPPGEKTQQNIGPSLHYRLRDEAGQASEFHSYMVPVAIDGTRVYLAGVRESLQQEFRYLRIPADENDALAGWLRLHGALQDADLRAQAAARVAQSALPDARAALRPQLQGSTERVLAIFAGALPQPDARGGIPALDAHIRAQVPEGERAALGGVLMRLLASGLLALDELARSREGLPEPAADSERERFMTQALLALSDVQFFPAPALVSLEGFTQKQASVFQVARAPGQPLVYLGAILLVIGIFAMLYVRERRLWLWLAPTPEGGSALTMALSGSRPGLQLDTEFEHLKTSLLSAP